MGYWTLLTLQEPKSSLISMLQMGTKQGLTALYARYYMVSIKKTGRFYIKLHKVYMGVLS